MTLAELTTPPTTVVFDIGGVMAEICHTWEDAARCADVSCSKLSGSTHLSAFEGFDSYQAGVLALDEYLAKLSEYAGCAAGDALRLHNGILVAEYPGILDLVEELQSVGLNTGCLSNTNAPHWDLLNSDLYPAIESLTLKYTSHMAGVNKPSAKIFGLFSNAFDLLPGSIAFFDDAQPNVDAAQSCGWRACWIDSTKSTPDQLRAYLRGLGVI